MEMVLRVRMEDALDVSTRVRSLLRTCSHPTTWVGSRERASTTDSMVASEKALMVWGRWMNT